ncbi:MAG: glycosyltransferase family 2 protein [Clostridia bacterium]|nr:glycosyltransferase family 2 protein [Clostridia bacterium]
MSNSKNARTTQFDEQNNVNMDTVFQKNDAIQNDVQSLRLELETYQKKYAALLSEKNAMESRFALLEEQYRTIENSQFWKLTKPFRCLLDGFKRFCKKNRVLRNVVKIFSSWKKYGFRYTARRVKNKIFAKLGLWFPIYTKTDLEEQRKTVFENPIKFSILVPLYNTPEKLLKEMIQSVIDQTYANWELCLADGSDDTHAYVETVVKSFADADSRIVYQRLEKNAGISENTNECAKMATGDYIALLDHDDLLAPIALFMNAKAIAENGADVLYSDEDHLSRRGRHVYPLFKPDWSPDLLYSQMYTCHFTVIRKSLFDKIGGFRSAFDGSQDYDLMLRLSEETDRICHIPAILYTWRESPGSTAANADAKPYAHEAGRNALDAHLKRRYGEDAAAFDSDYTFVFDARFGTLAHRTPLISIIIPFKDHAELTDACVRSILEKTTYLNYEILLLDNRSEKPETFAWFKEIVKVDPRIRILNANMEFNWAKLNNFGVENAKGEVYVFLNNDTVVISQDWLERLAENALRDDIGVVGGLLLYKDMTIQHAGVVVGLNQLADHVFKGLGTTHFGSPYISPMVSRNVLAVTGACMAISREKLDRIGWFDESFIICGSDVELCIRAYEYGYNNRYDVNVRLFHLESKSRSTYIPPIDFKRSLQTYAPYLEGKDPYYNINLNLYSLVPKEEVVPLNMIRVKRMLKRIPPVAALARALRRELMPSSEISIPEIGPINAREDTSGNTSFRLNFMTPSVDVAHVFGGISTAMNLFENLRKQLNCDGRIISTDADVVASSSTAPEGYCIVGSEENSDAHLQLLAFNDRYGKTIPVREKDIFVTTAWWTAYTIRNVMEWQTKTFGNNMNPLVYIIQDYEPGFYPWSSRYMMADSTYRLDIPTYAVLNSKLLKDFFDNNHYTFAKIWYFEPVLNQKLAAFLPTDTKTVEKKKQILVYGRPSIDRNAFALVVETLKLWKAAQPDCAEWLLYSAGEEHADVDLGDGCTLRSLGKLSLENYAKTMLDTYAGVSLMVSPHPSYPPLEMSTFGVKTVTNCYANKDLSDFNENMTCLKDSSPRSLANALLKICSAYDGTATVSTENNYAHGGKPFGNVVEELSAQLKNDFNLNLQ